MQLRGAALLLFFSGVRRGLSFRTEGGPAISQLAGFAALFASGLIVLLLPTPFAPWIVGGWLAVQASPMSVPHDAEARRSVSNG